MHESTASPLYGAYDLFASAGRDWNLLVAGKPPEPRFRPTIVSADGRGFSGVNGVWIAPQSTLTDAGIPDIVCVMEVFVAPEESLAGRFDAELAWLRRCYDAGAVIATACTGALLLAECGLLDGCDATTHWAYCDALALRYPRVRVHPNRALVTSGEGQRLIMAGGGTSWLDLAMFVIARTIGVDEAMQLARLNLIDWHDSGQLPFAALTHRRQGTDAVIADCQAWIARHYEEPSPVAAMERKSGLPERSFKRRFVRATGMTPLQYVQNLRLEEAKHLLETTVEPVEAVANSVGYEDAAFFGRLFRRRVGLTPTQYRRRFAGMRKVLEGAGATGS